MFDSVWSWFQPLNDVKVGAVGDPFHKCEAPIVHDSCGRTDMLHQEVISVPKSDLFEGEHIKSLNPVLFKGHSSASTLIAQGPSFIDTGDKEKIFSFTARVDPEPAIVNGLRIDWTSPPDGARILVSPSLTGKMHEATGWIVTKADGRLPGGIPQSQNIVFSHQENVRRIEIQMRDAPNSIKTQFGIDQVALVANAKDVLTSSFL